MGICPKCHKQIDHLLYEIGVIEKGEAVLWKTKDGNTELFHAPRKHIDPDESGFFYECPECGEQICEDEALQAMMTEGYAPPPEDVNTTLLAKIANTARTTSKIVTNEP